MVVGILLFKENPFFAACNLSESHQCLKKILLKLFDTLLFLTLYLRFFSDMHDVVIRKFKWKIIRIHKLVSELKKKLYSEYQIISHSV